MKAIFVFAHPDDESFSSGGTIAKLAKKGVQVLLITATRGEAGAVGNPPITTTDKLGAVREIELQKAARILGIRKVFFLDFTDYTLHALSQETIIQKIFQIIKEEQPDIVITFDKHGISNHPDHVVISKATTKAFKKYLEIAGKHIRLYHTTTPVSNLKKMEEVGLDYKVFGKMKGTPDKKITTIIDIKHTLSTKIKALKSHKTQQKDWEGFLKRRKHTDLTKEYFCLILENSVL